MPHHVHHDRVHHDRPAENSSPLAEKARTEEELRRYEEFLRQIADNVPGLVGYVDTGERYRFVNATFEEWFQRPRQQIVGHRVAELMGEAERQRLTGYCQQALAGERVSYEADFTYPDGVTRTVWGRYQPDIAADGRILGFYLFLMDITARKQAEAEQQLLADLADEIRLADESEELIGAAVRLVGDHLRVGRCLWIEIYAAEQRAFIHAQHCRDLPPVPAAYANADYSPKTLVTLREGHTLVNHDAQNDPRTAAIYATIYAPYQERAYVGVPFHQEGRWRGVLSVTTSAARQWQPREIHLLETVTGRLWLAVERLRLGAQLQVSEARSCTIFENVGVALWEVDFSLVKQVVDTMIADWRAIGVTDLSAAMRDHCAAHPTFVLEMRERVRIINVNEEAVRLYGRPKAELLRTAVHAFDPRALAHFGNELVLLAAGGERYTFTGLVETPQGEQRVVLFTVVFPTDNDGGFTCVLLRGVDLTALKRTEAENQRLLLATQSLTA